MGTLTRIALLFLLTLTACSEGPGAIWRDGGPGPDAATADGATGVDAAPGDAGTDAALPDPEELAPCQNGSCWDTAIFAASCSYGVINENFFTGLYNVHAYDADLHAGVPTRITLARTGGTWQPVLIIRDAIRMISDGEVGRVESGLDTLIVADGRSGDEAEVVITSSADLAVTIYVTGWAVVDGEFSPGMPTDSTYVLRLDRECTNPPGTVAPPDTLPGEVVGDAGTYAIEIGSGTWGAPIRVDAHGDEYVGFRIDFTPSGAAVDMEVLAWDGSTAVSLGVTNAGPGLRVLAARDPVAARTFWVRAEGTPTTGTLTITRTPLSEVPPCPANCDDLLQLPLPIDAVAQGYDMPSDVVYREQFGRRDLLTAIFHAGRRMASAGWIGFTLKDLSNWDGSQPPGHATHNDGFHADISLITDAGNPIWAGLCPNNGVVCTGAPTNFGAEPVALMIAALFETGMVSSIYLDAQMIPLVRAEADLLLAVATIDPTTHGIIHSNSLRHIDYHFHHIHVRVDGL